MGNSKLTYVPTGDEELDKEARKARLGIDQIEDDQPETNGQHQSKTPNAEEIYTQLNSPHGHQ